MSRVRWLAGAPAVQATVEAWLGGADPGRILRDGPRRRIVLLEAPAGAAGPILVKQFRAASGRHALRERLKARVGRSPAAREARFLAAAHAAGASPLEPLALGVLADGDRLLALPYLEGHGLDHWLDARRGPRPGVPAAGGVSARGLLERLGHRVAALHAAGIAHGDLHAGNVLVHGDEPVILDLQHARRSRAGGRGTASRAHLRDLGDLDFSLWGRARLADRVRLRAAALGLERPFDESARRLLRRVGRAAERRAFEHGERRTRRAVQPGRVNAALALRGRAGMRVPELRDDDVLDALHAHAEALAQGDTRVLQQGARACLTRVSVSGHDVVVKEVLPRGVARILADRLRGSPGRRAFQAGHGLLARGVGAARPLAYLETRRLGFPTGSWLLLEHLAGEDALERCTRDAASVVEPLLGLLDRLHRRGVHHGDLKATHVFLDPDGTARLVDLESVRFRRRLSDPERIEALAQLNASLPDALDAAMRRAAFLRYVARHPFAGGAEAALREVVRLSLARRHRWTGAGCEVEAPEERIDGIL